MEVDTEGIDRGNDDGDIATGVVVGVALGHGGSFVGPEADDVDAKAKITPDEESEEVVEDLFTLGKILDARVDEANDETHAQDVEGSLLEPR